MNYKLSVFQFYLIDRAPTMRVEPATSARAPDATHREPAAPAGRAQALARPPRLAASAARARVCGGPQEPLPVIVRQRAGAVVVQWPVAARGVVVAV